MASQLVDVSHNRSKRALRGGSRRDGTQLRRSVAVLHGIAGESLARRLRRPFREAIAPFGFVAFACGEIDLSDRERNVMFIAEWPEEWKRYYFESGFVHRDPVLNALNLYPETLHLLRNRSRSALFQHGAATSPRRGRTRLEPGPRSAGRARRGAVELVSLVGRGPQVEGADRSRLCLMSECLLTRVRALVQTGACALAPASLTAREIEALRLVVVGVLELRDRLLPRHLGIDGAQACRERAAALENEEPRADGRARGLVRDRGGDGADRLSLKFGHGLFTPFAAAASRATIKLWEVLALLRQGGTSAHQSRP